jgi:hypothetical protein
LAPGDLGLRISDFLGFHTESSVAGQNRSTDRVAGSNQVGEGPAHEKCGLGGYKNGPATCSIRTQCILHIMTCCVNTSWRRCATALSADDECKCQPQENPASLTGILA